VKLYHGTSEPIARLILEQGLRPRSLTGVPGNWTHTVDSSPDCVYFSVAYAPYFAAIASNEDERWAIVEVETDRLEPSLMRPDEDFLEQATRGEGLKLLPSDIQRCLRKLKTVKDRTLWFRENLCLFAPSWSQSIEGLGNAAYEGVVPPSAITRVAFFDQDSNPMIAMDACDPVVGMLAFKVMGQKHCAVTKWFFDPQEFFPGDLQPDQVPDDERFSILRKTAERRQEALQKRDGLEILVR